MKTMVKSAAVAVTLIVAAGSLALPETARADGGYEPVASYTPPPAEPFKNGLVRLRGTVVLMDDGLGTINTPLGAFHGNAVETTDVVIPEIDLTFFLTKNIAVETICCFTRHEVNADGALAAGLVGLTEGDRQAVTTWAIPFSLLFQYHFDEFWGLKPYVGIGPTLTVFFNEDAGDGLRKLGYNRAEVDTTLGLVGQVGVDISLGGNWYANLDVKKYYLEPDVRVLGSSLGPITIDDLELNPWLFSVGVGYRFNWGDLVK